jgi:hypothetical protein
MEMTLDNKFTFPEQKIENIVEFIGNLGYKVDKTFLQSTDSDVIVELLSSILEKLGIFKKEKLKIRFEGLDKFSYTGLHDRPIYIIKFFNSTKKFFTDTLGVKDYSSLDLFSPSFKRNKKLLSGIMNFYAFKVGEKETFTTMKENLENSIHNYKENLTKYERVLNNFQKIK